MGISGCWLWRLGLSLFLNRELFRNEPTFLKLLVLDICEHVILWLSSFATIWQRILLIVRLKSHRVRIWCALEELGIDGSGCTTLVILPEVDHLSKLCAHGFHLCLGIHVILSAETGWITLQLIGGLLLKVWLSDLLYASLDHSTLDWWNIEKETHKFLENRLWVHP